MSRHHCHLGNRRCCFRRDTHLVELNVGCSIGDLCIPLSRVLASLSLGRIYQTSTIVDLDTVVANPRHQSSRMCLEPGND
jgi:hypothetical protein